MLEDGEIDGEEDFVSVEQLQMQAEAEMANSSNNNGGKEHRAKKSKKHREKYSSYEESNEEDSGKRKKKSGQSSTKRKKTTATESILSDDLSPSYAHNDEMSNLSGGDIDERFAVNQNTFPSHQDHQPNANAMLMTHQPMMSSLLDLFKNTPHMLMQNHIIDPVVVEKENNKPAKGGKKTLLSQPLLPTDLPTVAAKPSLLGGSAFADKKRKALLQTPAADESEMTVSVESIEKKIEKKLKYSELQKERQKKVDEAKRQKEEALKQVICHFYQEGRCQKGDKCPFSHQVTAQQIMQQQLNNKKYEICKFYLNSFCSKGDKCTFMHGEFPCKFYYRNLLSGGPVGGCTNGDKCRFSHEPITNPLLLEAFERFLRESMPGGDRKSVV